MNDEIREARSIKIKPSVLREAHQKAKEEGQTLGRWLGEAIKEKIERELKQVK